MIQLNDLIFYSVMVVLMIGVGVMGWVLYYGNKLVKEKYTDLNEHYKKLQINISEGHSQNLKEQTDFISKLAKGNGINDIMEIGFNGGHSSETFLLSNPNCKVTSFDIGLHRYVQIGKEYIDNKFPYRHTLILGNSLESVPKFSNENPGKIFNVIFVDGNHEYEYAYNDIINCKKLANENTILVVDDIVDNDNLQKSWSIGPTKAWNDLIKSKFIEHKGNLTFTNGRGCSWGKYNF